MSARGHPAASPRAGGVSLTIPVVGVKGAAKGISVGYQTMCAIKTETEEIVCCEGRAVSISPACPLWEGGGEMQLASSQLLGVISVRGDGGPRAPKGVCVDLKAECYH